MELVPGDWTVQRGHEWAERIEIDIRNALPHTHITTHVEPLEDPASMDDQELIRVVSRDASGRQELSL
jgi:divalent metal cation (Fe/Co/Zn/Cd) transporter